MEIEDRIISRDALMSSNICRICLMESGNLKNIFDNYDESFSYLDIYVYCTSIQLDLAEDVNVTTNFCNDCVENLISFSNFKKICEQSENLIKSFIEESRNFEDSKSIQKIEHLEVEFALDEELEEKAEYLENNILSSLIEASAIKAPESEVEELEDSKEKIYTCEICNKSWKNKNSWKVHKHRHHPKLEESNQEKCDPEEGEEEAEEAETNPQDLPEKIKHKRKRLCPICGKMALPYHIKAHTAAIQEGGVVDEKKFSCDICGQFYKTSNSLIKHKRKHSDDKRYACEFCGEKFLHWASRRNHVYLKHTGERKFSCTFCPEKFYQKGKYNIHVRRHTGELPFECNLCSKKFITNVALRNHMVCHSGEKNFKCNYCQKAFGRKRSLMTHLKIHTNEKNYVCPVCNKAFIQNHVLRTHMKSHPGVELPPPGTVVSQKVLKNQEKFQFPENMYFAHYNS